MRIVPNNLVPCPVCKVNEGNERYNKSQCNFCEGWGTVDKDEMKDTTEKSLIFWQKVKDVLSEEAK